MLKDLKRVVNETKKDLGKATGGTLVFYKHGWLFKEMGLPRYPRASAGIDHRPHSPLRGSAPRVQPPVCTTRLCIHILQVGLGKEGTGSISVQHWAQSYRGLVHRHFQTHR